MIQLRYSRAKLLRYAIFMCAFPLLMLLRPMVGPVTGWFILGFSVLLPIGGLRFLMLALGDQTALREQRDGLFIRTNWGTRLVPWADFTGVGYGELTSHTLTIRTGSVAYLSLYARKRGGGEQEIRLVRNLLDIPAEEVPELVEILARRANPLPGTVQPA
jgi:hypothetical protein